MSPQLHILYSMALFALRPAAEIWAWTRKRRPGRSREADQRRGLGYPLVHPRGLWLHGSSVGEARLIDALADGLGSAAPALMTATTPAGLEVLAERQEPTAFAPLDFPAYVRRAFDAAVPGGLGLVETELWPNLLREAERREVPTVLLNARLSQERMRHYRRLSSLYRRGVRSLRGIAAQSEADAERFVALGAEPSRVQVAGSIKFDLAPPVEDRAGVRKALDLGAERPVWVAGSTRPGEESILLDALRGVLSSHPELLLILAPRHLDRLDEIRDSIVGLGLRCRVLERVEADGAGDAQVLLIDRIGVLNRLYAAADIAFVGGTLVPVGGHNVLEPAVAGVPVLFGPHRANVEEPSGALLDGGGAAEVIDGATLRQQIELWLSDPERRIRAGSAAAQAVARHRGALQRNLDLLRACCPTSPRGAA